MPLDENGVVRQTGTVRVSRSIAGSGGGSSPPGGVDDGSGLAVGPAPGVGKGPFVGDAVPDKGGACTVAVGNAVGVAGIVEATGAAASSVPLEQEMAARADTPITHVTDRLNITRKSTQTERMVPVDLAELIQRSAYVSRLEEVDPGVAVRRGFVDVDPINEEEPPVDLLRYGVILKPI